MWDLMDTFSKTNYIIRYEEYLRVLENLEYKEIVLENIKKAKNEIEDIGNVIENTVNPPGEDKRNFFKNLRAQRWDTSYYNVIGSRVEELGRQFKVGEINEEDLKEEV